MRGSRGITIFINFKAVKCTIKNVFSFMFSYEPKRRIHILQDLFNHPLYWIYIHCIFFFFFSKINKGAFKHFILTFSINFIIPFITKNIEFLTVLKSQSLFHVALHKLSKIVTPLKSSYKDYSSFGFYYNMETKITIKE